MKASVRKIVKSGLSRALLRDRVTGQGERTLMSESSWGMSMNLVPQVIERATSMVTMATVASPASSNGVFSKRAVCASRCATTDNATTHKASKADASQRDLKPMHNTRSSPIGTRLYGSLSNKSAPLCNPPLLKSFGISARRMIGACI